MSKFGLTGIDLVIILILVAGIVKGFFHGQGLINRIFGTLWGAVKALIAVMVLVVIVGSLDNHFHFFSQELVAQSYLYHFMLHLAQLTWNAILSLFGK